LHAGRATTHCDLMLRAKELKVETEVIHNASIMNAIGCTGLQLYSFGEAVSLVFFTESWKPDSFYDKVASNRRAGLHTLVLLDIKVKEPNMEMLARGKTVYEEPRFMTVSQAVDQMLEVERSRGEKAYTPETLAVGVARVGQKDQLIRAGTMSELRNLNFGGPLHSLIVPGHLQPLEQQFLHALCRE